MNAFHQTSDIQLIHLFQNGNNRALEELINRYKSKLFSSILFLVKDRYLAEDIFQDVFIKIIDTLRNHQYAEEGKFLQWATRIAHNMCIDHFRKVKRTPVITIGDDQDIFEVFTVEPTAETKVVKNELDDDVRRMLSMLPNEQREVLILRHFAELSFKEISKMTNCSVNTALGRMRYGFINMRRLCSQNHVAL